MAYQPLYATLSDTNAIRHTTSLRSKVDWINGWINSHLGEVANWQARAVEEELPRGKRGGFKGVEVTKVFLTIDINKQAEIKVEGNRITVTLLKAVKE